jgi:MalT-like TPR region
MVEQRTSTGPAGAPAPDGDVMVAKKLRLPPERAGTVPRPRLSSRLTEAAARELTLVCAPAGFGKTTLLADLSHQREREHLVMACVLLSQGRAEQAGALLERLHARAVAHDRAGSVIEVQALRALALDAAGQEPAALSMLADARAAEYVGRLLRSFGRASPSPRGRARGAAPGLWSR